MARRKQFKNIASGLYGSFISRNNDVGGYWGIGKLRLLAQQNGVQVVRIDLLAKSIIPVSLEFSKLICGYHSLLKKHLYAEGIPENWLASVTVELDFKPEPPSGKHITIATWGSLFKLVVNIADDMKKNHTVSGHGYCGPHNPRKESKSARTESF
uniref:hypothetical protein n=1 Tax=Methylomonas sp. PHL2-19 TaxID=3438878 RepID=UPI00402BF365